MILLSTNQELEEPHHIISFKPFFSLPSKNIHSGLTFQQTGLWILTQLAKVTKSVTFTKKVVSENADYCRTLNGIVWFKAGFPPSLIQGGRKLTLNSIWAQIFAFPSIVGSGSCFTSTNAGIMKVSAVLTWCGLSWLQAQDTARELSHSVLYFA